MPEQGKGYRPLQIGYGRGLLGPIELLDLADVVRLPAAGSGRR